MTYARRMGALLSTLAMMLAFFAFLALVTVGADWWRHRRHGDYDGGHPTRGGWGP